MAAMATTTTIAHAGTDRDQMVVSDAPLFVELETLARSAPSLVASTEPRLVRSRCSSIMD